MIRLLLREDTHGGDEMSCQSKSLHAQRQERTGGEEKEGVSNE